MKVWLSSEGKLVLSSSPGTQDEESPQRSHLQFVPVTSPIIMFSSSKGVASRDVDDVVGLGGNTGGFPADPLEVTESVLVNPLADLCATSRPAVSTTRLRLGLVKVSNGVLLVEVD